MSLRDVRVSLTKARRYHAAGLHKYAIRDLVKAENAYERVTLSLREKLQQTPSNNSEAMAQAAYDYSGTVERAIELGKELEEFRKEVTE